MKFPKIKAVTAIRKYLLHVEFTDGTKGDYDAGFLAGKGVFKLWDNNNNFFKVFIDADSGAISWPGELDIDTINVYCTIKNIDADSYLTQKYHAAY
jgi:hypothetical protein